MSPSPGWLPAALRYEEYGGQWDGFLEDVYAIFTQDFKTSRPNYASRPVVYDKRLEDGREIAFWHIVSEVNQTTGYREVQIGRCERAPWVRPTIENSDEAPEVSVWKNKRSGIRILLWLEAKDYLVVLEERPHVIVLITGYPTDREHTRRKLKKERERFRKKQAPP